MMNMFFLEKEYFYTMEDSNWNDYNSWNERDTKLSLLWVKPIAKWLEDNYELKKLTILDYGCGYFDLGSIINKSCDNIYGYDPYSEGLNYAKHKYNISDQNLTNNLDSFSHLSFDLIVLNSVLQYFHDESDIDVFFTWLQKNSEKRKIEVIISDIIPENYSAPIDAIENLLYASFHKHPIRMMKHLFKAATKSDDLKLFKIEFDTIKEKAKKFGLTIEKLNINLTPSKRRYSIRLTSQTDQ